MIIVRLQGGLGNQMFQYALGRALSIKNKVPLALDLTFLNHRIKFPSLLRPHFVFRDFDLDVFNIEAKIAQKSDIPVWGRPIFWGWVMLAIDAIFRKLPILPGWEKSFRFDKKMLSSGPNTYLAGFWQSEKYFKNISEILRKDFTLKEKISDISQKLLEEIKSKNSICIHVRRTDIAEWKSFHTSCGQDYYERGIAEIIKNTKIDKLYIFSDDINWCKENLKFEYNTQYVGDEYRGEKAKEHFVLMSACKHFVIANSTFSWWAAWLGVNPDKIVIAPKKWFEKSFKNDTDLIPKEWIRI